MQKKKSKVLVIGDKASGKSTLVQSFAKKNYQFTSDYIMTQGVQVHSKIMPIADKNIDVQLFLFDLSGNEFYESIALAMGKNPDLVMVVYDCTNQETFTNSLKWLDKVKKLNNKPNLPGVLVGAKSQYKIKEISAQEASNYAKKLNLEFFQVSAAYNTNVEKPFQALATKASQMPSSSFV